MGQRILLAVCGLSPQIVTETLYALTQIQSPPFVPDKIILLTTQEGARRARLGLLTGETAHFHKFCRDYHLSGIEFDERCIRVIKNAQGQPLNDIRTPQDNSDVADFICATVRELTAQPDSQLHVSIAGGRKTMGYYAGYALSLFGRAQDRLSHVLVSDNYESNSHFWYPTPYHQVIYSADNQPLDAADAKVYLAEIPFVRLREFLPDDTALNHRSFREIVDELQGFGTRMLRLNIAKRQVCLGNLCQQLEPSLFAFYLWFVQRAKLGESSLAMPGKAEKNQQYADEYLGCYEQLVHHPDMCDGRIKTSLEGGMDQEFFNTKRSKVNAKLRQTFGVADAHPIFIQGEGKRGQKRFAVNWPSHRIEII